MSRSRVGQWVQRWLPPMQICSWTDLREPSLPRSLSSLLSGSATLTTLCIWTGTRSELEGFLDRLNKAHRTLKFTWSISDERIEFLDLNLFKGGRFNTSNHLDMSTHFKKTNTFQYLHFSSSHPRGVFKGLIKGEAIRFLRSNTDAHTYNSTVRKLRKHLLLRGYPSDFIDRNLAGITHDRRASYLPNLTPSPSPPTPLTYYTKACNHILTLLHLLNATT